MKKCDRAGAGIPDRFFNDTLKSNNNIELLRKYFENYANLEINPAICGFYIKIQVE